MDERLSVRLWVAIEVVGVGIGRGFAESLGLQLRRGRPSKSPSSLSTTALPREPILQETSVLHFELMPAWRIVRQDPKLWKLLRKIVVANGLVTLMGALVLGVTHLFRLADVPFTTHMASESSTRYGVYLVRVLSAQVIRCMLIALRYGGQWPLYVVIQFVGVFWYRQLYTEVWLLRKGLYATFHEDRSSTCAAGLALTSTSKASGGSKTLSSVGVWDRRAVCASICSLLVAIGDAASQTGQLLLLLVRLREPPVPRINWVTGDKSKLQGVSVSRSSIDAALEAMSEEMFKTIATLLFSVGASFMEILLPTWRLGAFFGFLLHSFLYTFYVFDYRYGMQFTSSKPRVTLRQQLQHFETNWPYNIGYGASTTLVAYATRAWIGSITSVSLTSILYALQVVCCGYAHPREGPFSLAVFTIWFRLLDGDPRYVSYARAALLAVVSLCLGWGAYALLVQ